MTVSSKTSLTLNPIGVVRSGQGIFTLELDASFRDGLIELEKHQFLTVLWWGRNCDTPSDRSRLCFDKPYVKDPDKTGVFATRSESRPNPVLMTVVPVINVDRTKGEIQLGWIDADDGTPLIDIKPYLPATDRVEIVEMPQWCRHWPTSLEASAHFDWAREFAF